MVEQDEAQDKGPGAAPLPEKKERRPAQSIERPDEKTTEY